MDADKPKLDRKFFYANASEFATSQFDLTIKFVRNGLNPEINTQPDQATPMQLDIIDVSMSINHAKAMLAGLYESVTNYEKNIGPIALDKPTEKRFNEIFGKLKSE